MNDKSENNTKEGERILTYFFYDIMGRALNEALKKDPNCLDEMLIGGSFGEQTRKKKTI